MPKNKENLKRLQREWVARRKNDFFIGKSCKCGATTGLHLVRVTPGPPIRGIFSLSDERRSAVLAECTVVCEACGKENYSEKRRSKVQHGTEHMYMKYGCRCPACVRAASDARQERRGKLVTA